MKRKNGETQSALTPMLLLGFVFAIGFLIVGVSDVQTRSRNHSDCFNISQVTQIKYGARDYHEFSNQSPMVIQHLAMMPMERTTYQGSISHALIDIQFFDDYGFVGSWLLVYDEKAFQWYIQQQNAIGVTCGLYTIDFNDYKTFLGMVE